MTHVQAHIRVRVDYLPKSLALPQASPYEGGPK
jgi:hypothetical protein